MKSIGEVLRNKREGLDISVDTVVAETKISKRYIESMEADDFEKILCSEANLLGFIKMYALFLGLDVTKSLALYNKHKLVEEPAPMEQLMKQESMVIRWRYALWALGFIVVVGFFYLTGRGVARWQMQRSQKVKSTIIVREKIIYRTAERLFEGEFGSGDEIILILMGMEHRFAVIYNDSKEVSVSYRHAETDEPPQVVLSDEGIQFALMQGGANQLSSVSVIGLPSQASSGDTVRLRFQISSGSATMALVSEATQVSPLITQATQPIKDANGLTRQVLMSVSDGMPITPVISFKGYSYFRYRLDSNEVVERYYQEGEQFQRTMHGNLKMWLSNAGKARIKIGSREFALGRDGEVVVKLLYWQRNQFTNMLDLILEDMW